MFFPINSFTLENSVNLSRNILVYWNIFGSIWQFLSKNMVIFRKATIDNFVMKLGDLESREQKQILKASKQPGLAI